MGKNELINWIHLVEERAPERLAGLVTELYFSKKLCRGLELGNFSEVSEGWFYLRCPEAKYLRNWFKIGRGEKISRIEECLIRRLEGHGHKFFYILPNISRSLRNGFGPELTVSVSEAALRENKIMLHESESAVDFSRCFNSNLMTYLSRLRFGRKISLDAFDWFVNEDIDKLLNVFIQRCLMNSLKCFKPLDVDAIALAGSDDRIVFLEFKKKYPAGGSNKPIGPRKKPEDYSVFADAILSNAMRVKAGGAREKFSIAFAEKGYSYCKVSPGYGLDMVHYETLVLCEMMDVEYRYVIWKEGSSNSKKKQSRRIWLELNSVLGYDLVPKKKPKWWVRSLKRADVSGLSYTFGDDSGSYTKMPRMQVIFDE